MKSILSYDQMEDLDAESKYLVHKAKEATESAYAPYSKFHVGAALILDDGTLVTGSNQENASYPLSMCAERVAIFAAIASHPGKTIKKLAIVAHRKNHKELAHTPPCGACRQVLLEVEERQKSDLAIVFLGQEDKWQVSPSVSVLLPHHFDRKSLL